jgi:hypothetical protein
MYSQRDKIPLGRKLVEWINLSYAKQNGSKCPNHDDDDDDDYYYY